MQDALPTGYIYALPRITDQIYFEITIILR